MKHYLNNMLRAILVLALAVGMTGCATSGHSNKSDPLEPFNRAMFKFNDGVDTVALKPAATVYQQVLPTFVQTGVGNFFGNLADAWTAVNNFLQGKLEDGLTDVMRVAVNSTFGLLGVLDIGSEAGLPKHKEDFGQTLGKWGVQSGPYVVLPLFGPSTLRDTLALPVDLTGDPWSYSEPDSVLVAGSVLRVVDLRAAALDAGNLIEDAALDRYEFIRDAYLQRRESKVNDGVSPKEKATAVEAAPNLGAGASLSVAPVATFIADVEIKLASRIDSDRDAVKPSGSVNLPKPELGIVKTEPVLKSDAARPELVMPEAIRPLASSEPEGK